MKISQIFEENQNKIVVVYAGRFQPFHRGHYAAYKWLCKKFGSDNVWIATSNKTNLDPSKDKVSPLSFKERKEIIVGMYRIPARRVIQCKNPAFSPIEVFDEYKGQNIIYVAAVGDKDGERYKTNHQKINPESSIENLSIKKAPYFIEIPSQYKGVSGTMVRNAIVSASDDDDYESIFKKYFGEYDSMVARTLKLRFGAIK